MMRGVTLACALLILACAVLAAHRNKNSGKTVTRPIYADELRDFPGACFASTQCGTVEVGRSWSLSPYCGVATCAKGEDGRLVEVVEECAPPGDGCTTDEASVNSTAPFPDCCPEHSCRGGHSHHEEQVTEDEEEPPRRRKAGRGRARSRSRDY